MIKIAIVEDNAALRSSLIKLFNLTEGFKCVAALSNLLNVTTEVRNSKPDIILMDIGLPNISGIEGVRTIKYNFPEIQILMFTVFEEDDKIFEAIQAGANGYLLKKTSSTQIIDSIKELYNGGVPMSSSIARKVIESFRSPKSDKENFRLTTREHEILYSLVDGLSYKKIAEKYCISTSTIRSHIVKIYDKLHVHSKSQAVAVALKINDHKSSLGDLSQKGKSKK